MVVEEIALEVLDAEVGPLLLEGAGVATPADGLGDLLVEHLGVEGLCAFDRLDMFLVHVVECHSGRGTSGVAEEEGVDTASDQGCGDVGECGQSGVSGREAFRAPEHSADKPGTQIPSRVGGDVGRRETPDNDGETKADGVRSNLRTSERVGSVQVGPYDHGNKDIGEELVDKDRSERTTRGGEKCNDTCGSFSGEDGSTFASSPEKVGDLHQFIVPRTDDDERGHHSTDDLGADVERGEFDRETFEDDLSDGEGRVELTTGSSGADDNSKSDTESIGETDHSQVTLGRSSVGGNQESSGGHFTSETVEHGSEELGDQSGDEAGHGLLQSNSTGPVGQTGGGGYMTLNIGTTFEDFGDTKFEFAILAVSTLEVVRRGRVGILVRGVVGKLVCWDVAGCLGGLRHDGRPV